MTSCAKKVVMQAANPDFMRQPPIESQVLSLKTIGVADTTVAFISGLVTGKDSIENVIRIDTLPFAQISFIQQPTGKKINIEADRQGKFNQYLSAGTYNIIIMSIGYNQLKTENVNLRIGELKELNVQLGFSSKIY